MKKFIQGTVLHKRHLKKIATTSILFVFAILLFNCNDDKDIDNGYNVLVDATSMATPNGGKLNPAQSGPERSALGVPKIDLKTFQLELTGLIDSSFILTWDEILAFPETFSDTILMYCVEGWEVWGNWKGILIKDLLEKAHVQPEGNHILFECDEGYTTALPISYLVKYNALLAYQVNDAPLPEHDGFPLRLIAFGKFGYKWAKWVKKLEIMDMSQIGFWERQGYTDKADVPIRRRSYYEGDNVKPLEY